MATEDLKTFIENRLQALDPTIDLGTGSPAQQLFVQPLLTRLGTDPFETDIQSFILDRFQQEFPDIFAGDPGAVNDVLVKPLILLLEPFKREIQTIKTNQSLQDPTVLSDDDADALVANVFDERDAGGFAGGVARVYFPQPTNAQFQITNRFFTSDGLNYFPTNPVGITAEEMVFNRDGALYFADVAVKAENPGAEYNIDVDQLIGVVGVFGQVKVTNPRKFSDGSTQVDTPTFVAEARQSLNERSLVTRRGANARLSQVFQGDVRAVQVIGAGDEEMQRDILVASSPGHAFLTGQVSLYRKLALVLVSTVDNPSTLPSPQPGDTLFVYLGTYAFPGLAQNRRYVRLMVDQIVVGPTPSSTTPYELAFLVRWSDPENLLQGITLPTPAVVSGGFEKKGDIQISSLPSVGAVDLTVANQSVHVLGHSDIYVRPVLQDVTTAVLNSVVDDPGSGVFKVQGLNLQTFGTTAGLKNKVTDTHVNFALAGVQPGAIITLETGADAGTYSIGKVSGNDLYLTTDLKNNDSQAGDGSIRYRISDAIHVNPFEPKIPKIPFGTIPNNDLQSFIGLDSVKFNGGQTDVVAFGAAVGDILRIKTGVDAGDYPITGVVDGKTLLLNRALSSSDSGITYEIFTPLQKVELPLVRIKSLSILDSAKQSTGVDVPYGEPVAIVPTAEFTTAQVRGGSQRATGFVVPQLNDSVDNLVVNGNVAATSGDRRYSMGFDPANGIYKAMLFANGNEAEFLFPSDSNSGCSYFVASPEDSTFATNFPPIDPKAGDVLTIKSGPNQGNYLVKAVTKFQYQDSGGKTFWLYFVQIYGFFPVDVLRQLITFLDQNGQTVPKANTTAGGTIAFPSFFQNAYTNLGVQLDAALTSIGVTSPGSTVLQASIDSLVKVDYEWGDPARGVLRSYFMQPTLFQQNTALNATPTTYSFETETGELLKYRPNPNLYETQTIVPPRLSTEPALVDLPRDIVTAPASANVSFSDPARATMFSLGILVGDTVSIHPEVLFHGSAGVSGDRQTAVMTQFGSNTIKAPQTASGTIFTPDMVGNLVCIDQGDDQGEYTVVSVPDSYTITLDRPLTISTPSIVVEGNAAQWGYDGTNDKLVAGGTPFNISMVGLYLTLYGIDSSYQGSYPIASVPTNSTVVLTRPSPADHFPSYPQSAGRWIVTAAPVAPPSQTTHGTVLTGLQSIRIYDDIPLNFTVSSIPTDLSSSALVLSSSSLPLGILMPFRIFRDDIRRITPADMASRQDGGLFFFDTEVVSLGCQTPFNLQSDSYLTADEGTYFCIGYKHRVDDFTLSYSMKESGHIEIPLRILTETSPDSADNYLPLLNIPLQVNYEKGDIVQQFQAFLDSPEDRVTAANLLARHFLPAYVSYDASYVGGSAASVVAKDIIGYIDTLPIETPVDVSVIEDLIDKRGGNPHTPTKIVLNIHDWDRKQWVEFSEDEVGGTETKVPYHGSPRVTYFVPGPDVSGQTTISPGERINLVRQ